MFTIFWILHGQGSMSNIDTSWFTIVLLRGAVLFLPVPIPVVEGVAGLKAGQ